MKFQHARRCRPLRPRSEPLGASACSTPIARRSFRSGAAALAMLGLAAFVAPSLAYAAGPRSDLHYGPDQQQVLDLWLPPETSGPTPILVFFHGGAFVGGDKHPCAQRLIAKLVARGIAMACANYRLAPRVTYPVPMQDGARAVQWLRAHAAEFNLDAARIAVGGASAGGGIALWIGFHPDLADAGAADPVLRQSTRVTAVVTSNAQATYDPATIAAEFNTRQYPKFLVDLFGTGSLAGLSEARFAAAERDASPITYLHAGGPPVLAYYTSDGGFALPPDSSPTAYIHHPAQGALLQKVARARGAEVDLHAGQDYPGGWPGFLDAAAGFLAGSFGR